MCKIKKNLISSTKVNQLHCSLLERTDLNQPSLSRYFPIPIRGLLFAHWSQCLRLKTVTKHSTYVLSFNPKTREMCSLLKQESKLVKFPMRRLQNMDVISV